MNVKVSKKSTSNKASESMTIREILAKVLDSSPMKSESHEQVPSGWIPDAQKVVCRPPSSRPLRILSEICVYYQDRTLLKKTYGMQEKRAKTTEVYCSVKSMKCAFGVHCKGLQSLYENQMHNCMY